MTNRTLMLLMGVVAFLILVVGIVFVVALAGGSGSNNNQPASSGQSTRTTPKANTSGDICKGNTLVTFGEDPASILDPIQVLDVGTSEYVLEIYSGLVSLGLDLKVHPDIAQSWDLSPDGMTYTFHLRSNAVFQDSRRVTAQDVKYSLERAADPRNASPTVIQYLGDIVGLKDRYNNKATSVSGIKVVDQQTIQIQITHPSPYFLEELTLPVSFLVDQNQIQKDPNNWTRHPNGTGPFKLAEFTPGQVIRLVRNDAFYNGPAKLDEVDFQLGGGSILTQYENNELHVAAVPDTDLQAVKSGQSPLSKDYHPQAENALYYMAFNVKQPPFDDPNVREAMAMAVDRNNINNVLLFDSQRVADGILPPDMPGHSDSVHALPFDVQKAKDLLAKSKYANNMPRIVLTYTGTGGDAPELLQAIQSQWKTNLGIQVDLQATDYSAYLRELRKGSFQMFDAGWIADYPDPENFLDKLFASDSPQNELGYKDPTVDGWLFAARTEQDQTKRFALYNQAEQKIINDAIIIPTFWPVDHMLVKPCVKNWPQVSLSVEKYKYIAIDPNAK